MNTREKIILVLAGLVLATSIYFHGFTGNAVAERIACSSFTSQHEAEMVYLSNPSHYTNLDRDHDGKACESLPKFKK